MIFQIMLVQNKGVNKFGSLTGNLDGANKSAEYRRFSKLRELKLHEFCRILP